MDYAAVYLVIGKTILLLPLTWAVILTLLLVCIFEKNEKEIYLWRISRN